MLDDIPSNGVRHLIQLWEYTSGEIRKWARGFGMAQGEIQRLKADIKAKDEQIELLTYVRNTSPNSLSAHTDMTLSLHLPARSPNPRRFSPSKADQTHPILPSKHELAINNTYNNSPKVIHLTTSRKSHELTLGTY
jgi:hypothetical protein